MFSEVLHGLDLHRPPCSALRANEVYDLIAALAYGLMVAIKLLDLKDDCQSWRVKTLIKKLLFLPGGMAWRSRLWLARVCWCLMNGCADGSVGRGGCGRRTCRAVLGWPSPAADAPATGSRPHRTPWADARERRSVVCRGIRT